MFGGLGHNRYCALLSALIVLCMLALPGAATAGVVPPKSAGPLSPALTELARPSVYSQPAGRQARMLGISPAGAGALIREGGKVLVSVRFDRGVAAGRENLRAAGVRVLNVSRGYQTVTAAVAPAELEDLVALPDVASVTAARAPILRAVDCAGGSVVSEGVQQLNVDAGRESFGVDGSGVTVGVLSDSYAEAQGVVRSAEDDVQSADLPGTGNGCAGQTGSIDLVEDLKNDEASDEGRAMLQIVHDVAPGAALSFATAFTSEDGFAANIRKLAAKGADVIVDDVAYLEEPYFQDGPVAVAIAKVAGEGVSYFSAAGNDNLFDGEGNEIASWEAPAFRDSGGCPGEVAQLEASKFHPSHCLDFNPGAPVDRTFGIKVEPGETLSVDLQWAEPWEGVETDLDAFLLDSSGQLVAGSVDSNETTQKPLEIIQWSNETDSVRTVRLAINRFAGSGARLKFVLLQNGGGVTGVEYPRSGGGDVVGPAIVGHAGSAAAIAVGAVPFNNSSRVESYSSRGPATHYFGPVKVGPVPADPLPGAEVISKPDIAATDCGATTFFAFLSGGKWRFCGTSAAAPHAAGVAALLLESEPAATAAEVRDSLVGTAVLVGGFDSCAAAGGLVEALGALEALHGTISTSAPEPCAPPDAPGPVFTAAGDWDGEESQPTPREAASPGPDPSLSSAPSTFISKHPPALVRTPRTAIRLVFRFAANQSSTFVCRVDRARYRSCAARFVRRYALGRHVVRVKARNAAGLVDPTPAVFRFRVAPRP
jgi:subtilisin family serine protease